MKRLVVLSLAFALGACVSQPPRELSPPGPAVPDGQVAREAAPPDQALPASVVGNAPRLRSFQATPRSAGTEALAAIRGWYADTRSQCGGASLPAFLCGGVLLRATVTSPAFFPWDPSPASVSNGGISFSWIRRDTNFAALAYGYGNGFILYPGDAIPSGKTSYQVLCVFPMDADSNNRPSQQGCGPNTLGPSTSAPCDTQGIRTGAQWVAHFNAATDKHRGQCGWNVRRGVSGDTADRFMQSIDGRARMPASLWPTHNELRIATWPSGTGARLPIRAFFYVWGNAGALANAQNDQGRYRSAYDIDIPIIRMTLPASAAGTASFDYVPSDQTDPGTEPGPGTLIDFEDVPVTNFIKQMTIKGIAFEASFGTEFSVNNPAGQSDFVSGRRMTARGESSGRAVFVDMKLPAPVHSFSIGFLRNFDANDSDGYIACDQTAGRIVYINMVGRSGRVTCVASAGSAIKNASINNNSAMGTVMLDNIVIED